MAASSNAHAYVSIRNGGVRTFGAPRGKGSVVFVDLSSAVEVERVRELPAEVLREPRAHLLFRSDRPDAEVELKSLLERWAVQMDASLIQQNVGKPPTVAHLLGEPAIDLPGARAIELEALLEWGKAIWRPTRYHYRLPSGEHAAEFIKVSDAIRAPRDARVIASWLLPHVGDQTGLVIDTGTMTAVVEALQRRIIEAGLTPGPVAVLDQYPRTGVDVDDAVELASGETGRVLCLLSVNSSGAVRDRLVQALDRQAESLVDQRLVVMIDKREPPQRPLIETWSPLPGSPALVRAGTKSRDICDLCRDSARARIIPINPFSFDGMLQAQIRPIMPSLSDARANWQFWQACSAHKAVAVESRSIAPVPALRSAVPMPVRIRLSELIKHEDFRQLARKALIARLKDVGDDFSAQSDLVLTPEHELNWDGFRDFWREISPTVAPDQEPLPFPIEDGKELRPDVETKLGTAKRVTVFALGVVSGWSLQKALLTIQHSHPEHDLELQGLVLHARTATSREWTTLRNSYGKRLFAGFETVLPDRSPLLEEQGLLKTLDSSSLSKEAAELHEIRLRLCNGEAEQDGKPAALFYGSSRDAALTRNSLFGQRLDARATYFAVGSSMARARAEHDSQAAPEFRVFDLAGIARSYYDPLILASMFRWLAPHEAWWGWQGTDAQRTIATLLERAKGGDREILIPELLLGRAQGKVHDSALDAILAGAQQVSVGGAAKIKAAIELTEAMAQHASDYVAPLAEHDVSDSGHP